MIPEPLEVVFWDAQHGNATYIETPNGLHIAIDLGIGSYGGDRDFSPLLHLKRKYYVNQLDGVIITHPHKDHIDDIMNFYELTPKSFACPRQLLKEDVMIDIKEEDKKLFERYFQIKEYYPPPLPDERNPLLAQNNGGVDFQIFSPLSCDKSNINNHSLVIVISYANSKVIIAGDNEPPSWKELLEKDNFVKAIKNVDILLAPHHGRDSGFHSELFKHFTPYLTVISDGRFCDSSATSRYSNVSKGWTVHHRNGSDKEERKCVTTRSDGVIVVKFGYNNDNKPFIDVRIN